MAAASPLARVDGALGRWLFDPVPQYWAVIARVILGSSLLANWLLYLPHVQSLFGPDGITGPRSIARAASVITTRNAASRQYLLLIDSELVIWVLYGLLLSAALAFALGFRTRIAGALLFALHALFHARNPVIFYGWSSMVHMFVLYTLLSDPGRFVSVDAWLRRRRDPEGAPPQVGTGPAWPMRLIQVHVCCMYAIAGVGRLDSEGWRSGVMLYQAFTDTRFSRIDLDWNQFGWLLAPGSYLAFVLEPLAPILLWVRRIGPWWAVALLAMHVGIELGTTVGFWNFMMASGLVAFLPPEWLARAFARGAASRETSEVHSD